MKTYTHPTITLPAGSVVVKFYDDSLSGSETMPDCILDVGDVEDGFDINLGELRLPSIDIKLRNVNNYIYGTLLNTQTLRVSVTVDGENYFFGIVDLNLDPDIIELDSAGVAVPFGDVTISCTHIFILLANVTIQDVTDALSAIVDPFAPYIYLRQIFRLVAQNCFLKFVTFTDIEYVVHRSYGYYDTTLAQNVYYALDKVMFDKASLDVNQLQFQNYYAKRFNNLLEIFGEAAREYLFFPSVKFNGTDFKLKIMERDYQSNISFAVKKSIPSRKYLIKDITTSLANAPLTVDNTDIYFKDASTLLVGDEFNLELHETNIYRDDGLAATAGGTLSTTETDILISGNDLPGKEGTALITHGAATIEFHYNAKTATAFIGCTISTGVFVYLTGDLVTNNNGVWGNNMLLRLKNDAVDGEETVVEIINLYPANTSYTNFHEAIHNGYKYLYLNNRSWREIHAHGLKGDDGSSVKMEHMMPGYQTGLFSYLHAMHTVKKSVMKNESVITALSIAAL